MAFRVPNLSRAACAGRKAAVQPFLSLLSQDQLISLVRRQHFVIEGDEPSQDLRDVVEMCVESGALPIERVEELSSAGRGPG
jgi:hypothetical protein